MAGKIMGTKIAGVLGGMGPYATVDFMSKVISLTPADSDQDHVRLLVDHNPKTPDRQINTDEQRKAVRQTLADMALRLETAGADFLVMPCNTAHGFHDLAVERTSIPFVNIISETVAEISGKRPPILQPPLGFSLWSARILRKILPLVGREMDMDGVYRLLGL